MNCNFIIGKNISDERRQQDSMNLIYINTHDSGRVLSPYGYSVPTPSLLSFAKEALLFKQAYCVGPTCSPSRSGLLTGRYPHSNGMLGLSQRGFKIEDYNWHLVNHLKQEGYHTVLCGIQHEAGSYLDHEKGAAIIGYDEDITSDNKGICQEDLVKWDFENANKAAKWLKEHGKKEKFFLSYGLYATHRRYPELIDETIEKEYVLPPYPVPDTAENREDHARYMMSAAWFDKCFKVIIDAIKENNLFEDTLIIFTTDHGVAVPFSKCTLYDSGIGVSLLMRMPGALANGSVSESLISQIDVFPTICDLLKLSKPKWLQGESFVQLFSDPKHVHRESIFAEINFHTSYEPSRCIRTERYKYIVYFDETYLGINFSNIDESVPKKFLMENGLEKKIKFKEALFDLYYDMGERNNLADDENYSHILEDMRAKLVKWQLDTKDMLLNGSIKIEPAWKVNKKTCLNPSSKNIEDYENIPS